MKVWKQGLIAVCTVLLFVQVAEAAKQDVFSTWDVGTLREFLVDQGVVAPGSTPEKLRVLANQHKSAADTWYKSKKTALDKKAAEWKPHLSLDSDYIFSGWDLKTLTKWLKDQHADASEQLSTVAEGFTTDAGNRLSSAKQQVFKTYQSLVDNEYELWSDDKLREVLKTKDKSRDKLLKGVKDLQSKSPWTNGNLDSWLKARGVYPSDPVGTVTNAYKDTSNYVNKKGAEYVSSIKSEADEWLSNVEVPSATPYLKWTDEQIRSWLKQNKIAYDLEAKRDELLDVIKANYVTIHKGASSLSAKIFDHFYQHYLFLSDAVRVHGKYGLKQAGLIKEDTPWEKVVKGVKGEL